MGNQLWKDAYKDLGVTVRVRDMGMLSFFRATNIFHLVGRDELEVTEHPFLMTRLGPK